MPPTRRKACLACIRTKRKCDQGVPSCQRCLAVKRECVYVGRKDRQSRLISDSGQVEDVNGVESGMQQWQLQMSPTLGVSPGFLSPLSEHAVFNFPSHPFDFPSVSIDASFDSGFIEDSVAQQDVSTTGCFPPPNPSVQSRVEFAAKRLAALPITFASHGQTVFIHRMLFQHTSPLALQDALSTCALYSLKNANTQDLVHRNLEHKRNQLVANTDPSRASIADHLAAVQALLLYQIIRFFDGDIRLRSQAEADESIFAAWTHQLSSRVRQLTPRCLDTLNSELVPPLSTTSWQRWLVEESSRRTIIVAYMLKGVYNFLRTGLDVNHGFRVSFTAQTALWNAQSENGWQKALAEKEHFEISVAQWDGAVALAGPDDLEELGVLIMAMLWGLDRTVMWLGQSYAARYGLATVEPVYPQLIL